MMPASEKQRAGMPIRFWLPDDIGDAFKDYLASLEIEPTVTSAISSILRKYLSEKGFYPSRRRSRRDEDE